MKFLLSAFEPFDGKLLNASHEAISGADIRFQEQGWDVQCLLLPVVHKKAVDDLRKTIFDFDPDIILCFGEAGGRAKISLERVAINLCDYSIPDNEGNQPVEMPISHEGSTAYFSTLPLQAIHRSLNDSGFPCEISLTAGTYLCNELFYGLMEILAERGNQSLGGFIHLPILPRVAASIKGNIPSMTTEIVQSAIIQMMKVCESFFKGSFVG